MKTVALQANNRIALCCGFLPDGASKAPQETVALQSPYRGATVLSMVGRPTPTSLKALLNSAADRDTKRAAALAHLLRREKR